MENPITTQEQYRWAVGRVEQLLQNTDDAPPPGSPEAIELQTLSHLVADYSDKHYDLGRPTFAQTIKIRIKEAGMTQVALAKAIGTSPARLSQLLTGKAEASLSTASRICKELNIDPAIALGL